MDFEALDNTKENETILRIVVLGVILCETT